MPISIRLNWVLFAVILLVAPETAAMAHMSKLNAAFLRAVSMEDVSQAKRLLDEGADVNARKPYIRHNEAMALMHDDGFSALMVACENEDEHPVSSVHAMIGLLLRHGAEVNWHDRKYGFTAVMMARDAPTIQLLLRHHAALESRDKDGYTALIWQILGDDYDGVKLLLKHRANIHVVTDYGLTVLHAACMAPRSNPAIVSWLIASGASLEAKDKDGQTPLMTARAERHPALARLLAHHGATH